MSTPHLSVQNLGKKFGKLQVLQNITMDVEKGEYIVCCLRCEVGVSVEKIK